MKFPDVFVQKKRSITEQVFNLNQLQAASKPLEPLRDDLRFNESNLVSIEDQGSLGK